MSTGVMIFTRDLRVHDNPALAARRVPGEYCRPMSWTTPRRRRRQPHPAALPGHVPARPRRVAPEPGAALTIRHRPMVRRGPSPGGRGGGGSGTRDRSGRAAGAPAPGPADRRGDLPADPGSAPSRPDRGTPWSADPGWRREYKVFGPTTGPGWPRRGGSPFLPRRRSCSRRPVPPALESGPAPGEDRAGRGVVGAPSSAPVTAPGPRPREARPRDGDDRHLVPAPPGQLRRPTRRVDRRGHLPISPYLHFGCLSAGRSRRGCWPFPRRGVRETAVLAGLLLPGTGGASRRGERRLPRPGQTLVVGPAARGGVAGGANRVPPRGRRDAPAGTGGFSPQPVRMVVASFLTRDLDCDWRIGADHFRSLLVDADLALNQLNWQWVAGTGTDPNPHRVFNPTRQGQRFDPEGRYVRRYLPELAGLPDSAIRTRIPMPAGGWVPRADRSTTARPSPPTGPREATSPVTYRGMSHLTLCRDSLVGLSWRRARSPVLCPGGSPLRDRRWTPASRTWPWTDDTEMACSIVSELAHCGHHRSGPAGQGVRGTARATARVRRPDRLGVSQAVPNVPAPGWTGRRWSRCRPARPVASPAPHGAVRVDRAGVERASDDAGPGGVSRPSQGSPVGGRAVAQLAMEVVAPAPRTATARTAQVW